MSQKVKSELAPNLKMNFRVHINYAPSFMLLSQSEQNSLFSRLSTSTKYVEAVQSECCILYNIPHCVLQHTFNCIVTNVLVL